MMREDNSRKETIMHIVLEILMDKDTGRLTLADVADKLSMAKSTLYEYFDSKETMIANALYFLVEQHEKQLLDVPVETGKDFEATFLDHMRKLVELTERHRSLQDLTHHPEVAALPRTQKKRLEARLRKGMEAFEARLDTILDKGVAQGVLSPVQNLQRQKTIHAYILGAVMALTDPFNNWDVDAFLQDVCEGLKRLHQ